MLDKESFIYFAETKDIPYSFLETVGRAFVVQNNCKCIFINIKLELNKANEQIEVLKNKQLKEKQKQEESTETTSVFARLKTYAGDISNKKNEEFVTIPEKSNRYIYKGSLNEYESLYSNKSASDDFEQIDYNTFKKLSFIDEKKTL